MIILKLYFVLLVCHTCLLPFDFLYPSTTYWFYWFSLIDLVNQCWFKKCLVLVPLGDIRPEFCESTMRGLARVSAECLWAQLWGLNPWVEITVLCVYKLISMFGFQHLKNGIYSKTQFIDYLEELNLLKHRKCGWHNKCYANAYCYVALKSVLCFSLMYFEFSLYLAILLCAKS